MISLIVFLGRPVRSASSACDIPRDPRISSSVSPGAETTSGKYSFCIRLVMCIHHSNQNDCNDPRPVQPSIRLGRGWIYCRSKQKTVRSVQINRQLAVSVTLELMASARKVAHHLERRSSSKFVESTANQLCPLNVISTH